MRPYLEHIASSQDSSWTLFDRRLPAIPFEWHYNTEYELTLTRNSRGQRFIGDSIAPYDDGDLVLIGPRIPHTWCSSADIIPGEPHQALVLWFTQGLVESLIRPHLELHPILHLLDQSLRAVAFSDAARSRAQPIILAMLTQSPGERLPGLLQLLLLLAADREATLLTSPLPASATENQRLSPASEERIGRVLRHLSDHYREEPSIAELARIAALSRSSLHRLFKLQTGATIHEHIARLRIGNACALLLNTDHPITLIADHVGYRNLAHFNRQFKALKHRTPREFRKLFA